MSASNRDRAESIRHRLRNRIRERGEDVQFALQRYAQERFLYRLGESSFRERFILKGAMLFALWGGSVYRPTRDLDFTGYGSSDEQEILATLRRICEMPGAADEVVFDGATLVAEPIRDEEEYHGLRIRLQATLGESRIPMQIDIGFGNAIEPPALDVQYPTLLNDPPPRIRAYPQEAVIAEKLHAMVLLGERTSRFKDFYDLYVLACQFSFEGPRLGRAIAATFERRNTTIDAALPAALAPRFFADAARAQQWRTYLDRNRLPGAPADFGAVGELLRRFLGPPWSALVEKKTFGATWQAGGPWGLELEAMTLPIAATLSPQVFRADQKPGTPGALGGASGTLREEGGRSLRRFRPYPAYKDSGVEWLGEIPARWKVGTIKRHVRIEGGGTPSKDQGDFWSGDIPWVSPKDMKCRLIMDTLDKITEEGVRQSATHFIPEGAVLIVVRSGILNHSIPVAMAGRRLTVNQDLKALIPSTDLVPEYLMWIVEGHQHVFLVEWRKEGATVESLELDLLRSTRLPLPETAEQRAIAAFLDRETAKIDALVAKKGRLIELLQEKRTALITRAVTKGLDPNVPMKDSGIEWLGEIPAHWEIKRLWHLTPAGRRIMYGIVLPGPNVEDGVPIVKGGDVSVDRLRLDRLNRTTFEIESGYVRSRLRGGDLVYAIRGSIGEVAVVPDELEGANLTQDAARVAYAPTTYGRWLLYVLKSAAIFAQLESGALGATIRGVNIRDLKRAALPVPGRAEQVAIARLLDDQTAKIDALETKIRDAIDRLKELRIALISAAVTGKIDVREKAA